MSYELIQELVDQLENEDPKVRRQVARRLGQLGDPRAITHLSNLYLSEDEHPSVKKAAAESLGVFRAMQEALARNEDVVIPEPDDVQTPRFSSDFLRSLLIVLAVLMVILWAFNGLLLLSPGDGGEAGSGGGLTYEELRSELERRYALALEDVQNQRAAWQALQNTGQLNCDVPLPASLAWPVLEIDEAAHPALYHANLSIAESVTRLSLAANIWQSIGCQDGGVGVPQSDAAIHLQSVEQAEQVLATARGWLDQARAQITPTPTPTVESGAGEGPDGATEEPDETAEPTATPSPTSTDLPLDEAVYHQHINGMREKIDLAAGGRGVVTLLEQYWTDVRTSGQTGGCAQMLSDDLMDDLLPYALPPEVASADMRLQSAASILNTGLALARDSLANFQQGCRSGDFAAVLDVGEQRVRSATDAFDQVSALLNQIQAEVGP